MNTKSESLAKSQSSKAKSYAAIKRAVAIAVPVSRSELAELTGLLLSSVCGRCNELIKFGELVAGPKVYDKNTDRNVNTVALPGYDSKVAV